MNSFGFYVDEMFFEYDEQIYVLINYRVDHRDQKQDIRHRDRDDGYEQDRKELKNCPKVVNRMNYISNKKRKVMTLKKKRKLQT